MTCNSIQGPGLDPAREEKYQWKHIKFELNF